MKKTGVVLVTFVLGFMLTVPFLVELQTVEAQPRISLAFTPNNEEPYSYGVNIGSPANTTYTSNSLLLNVTLKRPVSPNDYDFQIIYSINGEANVSVPSTVTFFDESIPDSVQSFLLSYTLAKGVACLSNLSEGSQSLTVYGIYTHKGPTVGTNWPAVMHDAQTIYFMINDGVPPSIKNLQIQNSTHHNSLSLNFGVDEPISWMGYSLDEKANVTFNGNTLNGLAYGSHSIVVYANDTIGNKGTTRNMNFTIAKPKVAPTEILPTVVFVVLIGVAVTVLLLLRRHRKKKASGQNLKE